LIFGVLEECVDNKMLVYIEGLKGKQVGVFSDVCEL
jgi:hypothetical protein